MFNILKKLLEVLFLFNLLNTYFFFLFIIFKSTKYVKVVIFKQKQLILLLIFLIDKGKSVK